jgi:hypothetical protein
LLAGQVPAEAVSGAIDMAAATAVAAARHRRIDRLVVMVVMTLLLAIDGWRLGRR